MENISKYLNCSMPISLDIRNEVSSTNTLLKEAAAKGAAEGTVILAESQTAGRGRLGRSFFSPAASGLYLSILLRPSFSLSFLPALTPAAAAAAAIAIEEVSGQQADIKWVNDIWQNGKKLCGILCEAAFCPDGKPEYVVAGIGINISEPEGGFPRELNGLAGAIFPSSKQPQDTRSRLAAGFINHFTYFYQNIAERNYFPEYQKRCFLLGKEINVLRGGKALPATALALNSDCHLLVRYNNGSEEFLNSGEVSIRPR